MNTNGIAAYQQMGQSFQNSGVTKKERTATTKKSTDTATVKGNAAEEIKKTEWKPVDAAGSLVPKKTDTYGMAVGDVELSEKAQKYYNQLKAKFGNSEFILVSKDMKAQVQANAAAYGNASKLVVLIDEEKVERMANDEAYRKKYEGIIAMSQGQLAAAKNSLTSSGANLKNFGMSVNSDGTTEFFATVEKSSRDLSEKLAKKREEKKAAKVKEEKKAQKKKQEEKIKEAREKKAEQAEKYQEQEEDTIVTDEQEYVTFTATSADSLISHVSQYVYNARAGAVLTDSEKSVGQMFDFKG